MVLKLTITIAHASPSQQHDVSVPGISASQSADVTDQRNQMMAQKDILKISEFIGTGQPMLELPQLEFIVGPNGPVETANGEITSLINISI